MPRLKDISDKPAIGQIFLLRDKASGFGGCLGVLLEKDAEAGVGYLHPVYTPPYEGFAATVDEDLVVDSEALSLPYVTNAIIRPSIRARVPLAALSESVGQLSGAQCSEVQRRRADGSDDLKRQQALLLAWENKVDALVGSRSR